MTTGYHLLDGTRLRRRNRHNGRSIRSVRKESREKGVRRTSTIFRFELVSRWLLVASWTKDKRNDSSKDKLICSGMSRYNSLSLTDTAGLYDVDRTLRKSSIKSDRTIICSCPVTESNEPGKHPSSRHWSVNYIESFSAIAGFGLPRAHCQALQYIVPKNAGRRIVVDA